MWVLSPVRPPSSCETLDYVFQYQSGRAGFDNCQDLDYFCFFFVVVLILPSIFQFLWNSPQKVVSNSSTNFLWFELKK